VTINSYDMADPALKTLDYLLIILLTLYKSIECDYSMLNSVYLVIFPSSLNF
jgi:hypothetical protein